MGCVRTWSAAPPPLASAKVLQPRAEYAGKRAGRPVFPVVTKRGRRNTETLGLPLAGPRSSYSSESSEGLALVVLSALSSGVLFLHTKTEQWTDGNRTGRGGVSSGQDRLEALRQAPAPGPPTTQVHVLARGAANAGFATASSILRSWQFYVPRGVTWL